MNWSNLYTGLKTALPLTLTVLCCACASTPPLVDTNVHIDFPVTDRIETVDMADQVLQAVTLSKKQIDWRYRQKEQLCYTSFFTNHCLLEAKNERHADLARVKKSEVEANFFKRKYNVEEMDRSLAERNLTNPLPEPNSASDSKSEKRAALTESVPEKQSEQTTLPQH